MKVGIFGGSFDPIHLGHLVLAEYVRDSIGIKKVSLMPAYESPFKIGMGNISAENRLNMVKLAANSNPYFHVSDYEMKKGEVSYTVDTLKYLRENYFPKDEIYFIAGTDSFLNMNAWKRSEELFSSYSFAIGLRPGYREKEVLQFTETIRKKYNTTVEIVKVPQVNISSTDIRKRIGSGQSIKYLVPEAVERYITENNLYKK